MSDFGILGDADARQIETADTAVQQSLAYDLRGKKQISFAGVKWLILKMSEKEQPMHIEVTYLKLVKHSENREEWMWDATVRATNQKTDLETMGAASQAFLVNGAIDQFGRTKALSKAERNAYRKQIPELEIHAMLNTVSPDMVQKIRPMNPTQGVKTKSYVPEIHPGVNGVNATHGPSEPQLKYLKALGYKGEVPKTLYDTSLLIHRLKSERNKK